MIHHHLLWIIFEMDRTRCDLFDKVLHQLRLKNLFREDLYRTLIRCSFQENNAIYRQRLVTFSDDTSAWILAGRYFFFRYSRKHSSSPSEYYSRAEHKYYRYVHHYHYHKHRSRKKRHRIAIRRFFTQAWERLVNHHHSHYHLS